MAIFALEHDLSLTRNTDIKLPQIKFVDLRDGMQAGDCAVNTVPEAIELLIIQSAFAHAYNKGNAQFEVGFAASSELGVNISQKAAEFLQKIGMGEKANLFARTMHYKKESPEDDLALTNAVEEAVKAGMTSMTFVSKATPRQTRESFNLDTPEIHIAQVGESFRYAREQGMKDLTLDPEHSFEAMRGSQEDREFFMRMCISAFEGGCRRIVLCDTNGETTPDEIAKSLQWLHSIGENITDAYFQTRWQKMMAEMQWGLHLHDDSTYALASTMKGLDTGHVDHVDMTLIESGERGGGNNQFFKWACQMMQERGINVFGDNKEIWKYMVACSHRVSHIMHRRSLRTREHRLGRLAAAQTAGMHTVVQGRSGTLYRPNAHGQAESVLDPLQQVEVFSLNRQAGGENIRSNMRAFGFTEQAKDDEQVKKCNQAITSNLDGENGDICYSLHKASAALRFWQTLHPSENLTDLLNITYSRVEAKVQGDAHAQASAMITFDENGGKQWIEETSNQGILDAQFKALMSGLKQKNAVKFQELENVEIVDYHQHSIGTGSNARVITSMTMIDTATRQTWAVSCVRESSFNSAYECMKDGLRYWLGVKEQKFTHYQDPGLHFMHHYTPEMLIRGLYKSVQMNPEIPLDFLKSCQPVA